MTTDTQSREKLIQSLLDSERESSTWTILFHQAIADRLNLNITDHKCLDLLNTRGAMTAGQLAEITGLTTGAITGVIDRLEKAGFARRARDPNDRRRVIVEPEPNRTETDMGDIFAHFQAQVAPLLANFTDEELALLVRYTQESIRVVQEEISWLRKKD